MVRKIEWKTFLIIGIITFIFFISGIYTGIILSKEKVNTIEEQIKYFSYSLRDTELTLLFLSLFGKKSCDLLSEQLSDLEIQSEELRKDVAFYETTEKITDPSYIEIKRNYMSVMLTHWLYHEQMKRECNVNSTVILYFYSNKYCGICEDQGIILTYLKKEHWDNLVIFSFDFDLDVRMIDYLGKLYDFEAREDPVLIIDDEKHEEFLDKEELEEILCEKSKLLC